MFNQWLRAILAGIPGGTGYVLPVGGGSRERRTPRQLWIVVSLLVTFAACSLDREPIREERKLLKRPRSFPKTTASISTDIFSIEKETNEIVTSEDAEENDAIDDSGSLLPTYSVYIEEEAWDELHEDVYADVTVPASLVYKGKRFDIGLEIQGASTRKLAKKSYKLKFDKNDPLKGNPFNDGGHSDSFDKLFLKAMFKDDSRVREAIAFELWRWMGGIAPRVGMATLYINDDYWGLYAVVEPVDKDFLERNGYARTGNLYKATRSEGERADFAPNRDIKLAFEKRTNSKGPWNDLFDLVEILQKTPTDEEAFMEDIDPIFPIEEYFKRMIWVSYSQNADASSQNFYLYNSPSDGKPFWHIFPWDSDISLGNHWSLKVSELSPSYYLLIDGNNYFSRRLMKIDSLREQYIDLFEDTITNLFTVQRIRQLLDYYFDLVEDELDRDFERWHQDASVEREFDEVEDYFHERPSLLLEALAEYRETGEFRESREPSESDGSSESGE